PLALLTVTIRRAGKGRGERPSGPNRRRPNGSIIHVRTPWGRGVRPGVSIPWTSRTGEVRRFHRRGALWEQPTKVRRGALLLGPTHRVEDGEVVGRHRVDAEGDEGVELRHVVDGPGEDQQTAVLEPGHRLGVEQIGADRDAVQ